LRLPQNKGIHSLWRYVQIGQATNRRYLDALAEVKPSGPALAQLDSLCRHRVVDGQHCARFNPVSRSDSDLFAAVLSGAHLISGRRNRDIQQQIRATPARDPLEARHRCQRVCRILAKMRGHGLLGKVPGRRRYRVTLLGRRLMAAAVHYRRHEFPLAYAA